MPGLENEASEHGSVITSSWESFLISLPQFLHLYKGKSNSPCLLGLFGGGNQDASLCRGRLP